MKVFLKFLIIIDLTISGVFILINFLLPVIFGASFHNMYFNYNIDILYYYMWKYINIMVNIKTISAIVFFIILFIKNKIKRKNIEIKIFNIFLLIPSIILMGIIFTNNIWNFKFQI